MDAYAMQFRCRRPSMTAPLAYTVVDGIVDYLRSGTWQWPTSLLWLASMRSAGCRTKSVFVRTWADDRSNDACDRIRSYCGWCVPIENRAGICIRLPDMRYFGRATRFCRIAKIRGVVFLMFSSCNLCGFRIRMPFGVNCGEIESCVDSEMRIDLR